MGRVRGFLLLGLSVVFDVGRVRRLLLGGLLVVFVMGRVRGFLLGLLLAVCVCGLLVVLFVRLIVDGLVVMAPRLTLG